MAPKEKLASRYEQHHALARGEGFAFERAIRLEFFKARIGTGRRILDLGCRDGTMAMGYMDGNEVTGIDVDRQALERAEARGLEVLWADLSEPLPFEDQRFDAAVLGEILEHLPDPGAVLDEVARVLTAEGVLVGSVPNAFRLKNRLRFLTGKPVEPDPTHLQQFSPDRLRAELERRFEDAEVTFEASRFLRLSPRLFGNSMLFMGRCPTRPDS